MAEDFYVPQIDYRSRDFTSIRDDMIDLIPNFAPQWTSRDATDFGIVLIEMFAYMGDLLNYYIDRAANENFLSTATQRDTVLNIARLLNYAPTEAQAATATVTVTNNTASPITLKTYATFSTNPDTVNGSSYTFEYTGSDYSIGAGVSTAVAVTQGTTKVDQTLGTGNSDGTASQRYSLGVGVVPSSVQVKVQSVLWTRQSYLIDATSTDTAYEVIYDGNGTVYVKFGDGVSGKIPPSGNTLTATYRVADGSKGNVGASTIANITSNPGGTTAGLNVTAASSTAASGGADLESTDSIRINAPLSLRSLNRAVSLADYATLAVSGSRGVQKANAIAETYNSVILFVAGPNGTDISAGTMANIKSDFIGKTPPGVILTVSGYTKAYPQISATIYVNPSASNADVLADVQARVKEYLSYDNVTFNDTISQGDIYKAIMEVDGVYYVKITGFDRSLTAATTSTVKDTMYFYVNEIPTYSASAVSFTAVGGV